MDEEDYGDLEHDVNTAIKSILSWWKHLPRSVQQIKAKNMVMELIKSDSSRVLWIRDWAQMHMSSHFYILINIFFN